MKQSTPGMIPHPGIKPIPQNWKISKDGLGNLHIYEPATDAAEFRIITSLDSGSDKDAALLLTAPKLLAALREMAEWHGASHDEDCPCDDTCNCSCKPFNDLVDDAIISAERAA